MDDRGQIALGIIILVLSVFVVVFVGWVFVMLTGPIYTNLTLAETQQQLGTDPSGTVLFFTALAFIGLIAGMMIWFINRPLGEDVRQSQFGRRGP